MTVVPGSLALLLLQAAPGPFDNPMIPLILMVVVFYLVVFLPMRRRQRNLDQMLANLKSGDRVVTNGGLVGVVTNLTEKTVTLRVRPDNTKLEFARSAVSGISEEEADKS